MRERKAEESRRSPSRTDIWYHENEQDHHGNEVVHHRENAIGSSFPCRVGQLTRQLKDQRHCCIQGSGSDDVGGVDHTCNTIRRERQSELSAERSQFDNSQTHIFHFITTNFRFGLIIYCLQTSYI